MTTEPKTEQQGTHCFIITRQAPAAGGLGMATWSGHITPAPDATRLDIYLLLLAEFDRHTPQTVGGNTVFFSLEPNQL